MGNSFDALHSDHQAPGDREIFKGGGEANALTLPGGGHPLDSEDSRAKLRQLLEWYYLEREIQSMNRLEMAMDADFYDSIQWDPEDADTLRERGQMPLVYNEIAPMVDWIIGTERRTRVDWKVMPRAEDDVEIADVKTKVLKYVSDVNRVVFARSRAFADAIKVGLGWLDDGPRDDPTKDVLYSKWEDWRNVLHDSRAYEPDLSDARFVFRWRWVDEDIALLMFPQRQDQIRAALADSSRHSIQQWEDDQTWGSRDQTSQSSGQIFNHGMGTIGEGKRRQVKLIEAQFRMPARVKIINSGPLKGAMLHESDTVLRDALGQVGGSIIDKVMMRVHMAVFTESDLLAYGPSTLRHNSYTLTPIFCYRRGRDRLPYGAIRRVRDIQQDLNKRASKALHLLNTNQIIADEGAVDNWDLLRDEAARADGTIIKKAGKQLEIRRDTDAATGQIQMMTLDAQSIQKTAGVNNENLGRATNAVSGEAIKARQLQGSVGTTEPFDNLRFATQVQGEKQLSLVEQFYTEEKVIRLTGAKGAINWVYVNKPETQPDGSVRYLNDMTASMGDFVVAEQDYSGTLRQVMFESLNQMATRLPPEIAMRLLTIAMDFSDLPNKDEIADMIRKLSGDRDPNKPMTPEEMQQAQQQMQQQAEAMQMQRETAMAALAEQQAKVREINARAAKMESEAAAPGQGGMPPEIQRQIQQVQQQAADQIDQLSQALTKAQSDLANRTMAINKEADTKIELGRIESDTRLRVAEIESASDKKLSGLQKALDDLSGLLDQKTAELASQVKEVKSSTPAEPPSIPAPAAPAQPSPPLTINVQVDAKGDVKKSIVVQRDKDGNITGANVDESTK